MNPPRLATKNDMPRVYELIQELAIFEKEPDAVEVTVSQLIEDGFGKVPKFVCFVVEVENKGYLSQNMCCQKSSPQAPCSITPIPD